MEWKSRPKGRLFRVSALFENASKSVGMRFVGPIRRESSFHPRCKETGVTNKERQPGLTDEELQQQDGEELPDREAMSLINANVAAPINAAVALNALSDGSTAVASATQTAPITQTT